MFIFVCTTRGEEADCLKNYLSLLLLKKCFLTTVVEDTKCRRVKHECSACTGIIFQMTAVLVLTGNSCSWSDWSSERYFLEFFKLFCSHILSSLCPSSAIYIWLCEEHIFPSIVLLRNWQSHYCAVCQVHDH